MECLKCANGKKRRKLKGKIFIWKRNKLVTRDRLYITGKVMWKVMIKGVDALNIVKVKKNK